MRKGKVEMTEISALGVSAGIGIGHAVVLEKKQLIIPDTPCESPEAELARFEGAIAQVSKETQDLIDKARAAGEDSKADILDAYVMLVEDPAVTDSSRELIQASTHNAAQAVKEGMDAVVEMFESMDDDYMRERAFDIRDIQQRILRKLLKVEEKDLSALEPNTVVAAEDLTTSDTAKLDIKHVCGIITGAGGQNSHASIMARNFEIPALAAAGDAAVRIADGSEIVLDGSAGVAYVDPTPEKRAEFAEKQRQYLAEKALLDKFRGRESTTADGKTVELCANIGTPAEVERVLENTADGVGLLRSEFLYMDSGSLPDESAQFDAYKAVVMGLNPKPVIVRTMDIGGDKELAALNLEKEDNPFLGYRAIRICLDRPQLFKTQLRALLRASHFGNLKIMFPMISSLDELRAAKAAVEEAKAELRAEGLSFNEKVHVGIMIEVPAAALMAKELAKECDFFSIGTNDLIQYTTAVDRGNKKIGDLYSPYHPAVLRLIAHTIESAHAAGIPCGMCGEAAGDPLLIPALLGMGLDEFSMSSGMVLRARSILADLTTEKAQALAKEVLALPTWKDVKEKLEAFAC